MLLFSLIVSLFHQNNGGLLLAVGKNPIKGILMNGLKSYQENALLIERTVRGFEHVDGRILPP